MLKHLNLSYGSYLSSRLIACLRRSKHNTQDSCNERAHIARSAEAGNTL